MSTKKKVAVLISGNGSNLQALIDAAAEPDYPAEITLVISNKPEAYGLTRAKNARVPTLTIQHQNFENREAFDRALDSALTAAGIEIVCLAGFMRLLSPWLVEKWEGHMLNIHPSLLPKYKGTHSIARALEAGDTETGCTVHLVTAEMDEGPILAQATVAINPTENLDQLTERVHSAEHALYVRTLAEFARK